VHDVSDGGLFAALIESALPGQMGFDVHNNTKLRQDVWLFGEAQGRYLISCSKEIIKTLGEHLEEQNILFDVLGRVLSENEIIIDNLDFGRVDEWKNIYDNTLENLIEN
jgi:phosphoribosylformylglycinamidine synthase